MKNKFLYLTVVLGMMLGFSSCNLDVVPSDELNSDVLLQDASGAGYIMDGCYAMLKDEIDFLGYSSGNTYIRHYTQLSEFPSDNICLSAHSEDPLYEATCYMMNDGLKNVGTLWMVGYKVIYMCNTVISTLDEKDESSHQLLGEAYFMRGLMHLHLVTLYAKPYSHGRDNLGIPLRTSTSSEVTVRNPVGEVYDQIVLDLRKAADLMGKSRGNAGYPSKDAALGLLSRVYLYMEDYDKCIATVDEALNGASAASKLDPDLATYFANAKDRDETLFCVVHETVDDRGQGSIGSMYLKDGIGWGEVYPSDPLMALYERYPMDVRYSDIIWPQYTGSNDVYAYFPEPSSISEESGSVKLKFKLTDDGAGNYSFKSEGKTYNIEKRQVNGEGKADAAGEYFENHVNFGGKDMLAFVSKEITLRPRYTFPMIFSKKFSYQDGNPMLASPVLLRWGEVILNRAEAYAHKGMNAEALDDVNAIRTRAGIPAAGLFAVGNLHGYDNVLNVVMDERRLELAFEGFRMHDIYRNKRNMDRQYAGIQPWKIHKWDEEKHIVYPIPNNEWTVSHIPQNPGY